MIGSETVNYRADLEGQKLPQLYTHAVQTSIGQRRAALVSISCPDLRALVLLRSYGANLYLCIV